MRFPQRLMLELTVRRRGIRPELVISITTFACGHERKGNTWVDANGQARCTACRRVRRTAQERR